MIKSLNKSLAILNYIASKRNASVTEIASHFGMDKGSVSKILSTFAADNYVCKTSNMKYRISWGVLPLSYRIEANSEIFSQSRELLYQLASAIGSSVHLCAVSGDRIFTLLTVNTGAVSHIYHNPYVPGLTIPVHCTSFGKIIYAFSEDSTKDELMKSCDFFKYTDKTQDPDEFMINNDLIKAQGYAVSSGEYIDGLSSVAVPVFSNGRYAPYAIGISGNSDIISRSPFRHNNAVYPSRLEATLYFIKKVSNDLADRLPRLPE